eukprot:2934640-Amphidinium_carterae.1
MNDLCAGFLFDLWHCQEYLFCCLAWHPCCCRALDRWSTTAMNMCILDVPERLWSSSDMSFEDTYVLYKDVAAAQGGDGWKMKNDALFVRPRDVGSKQKSLFLKIT